MNFIRHNVLLCILLACLGLAADAQDQPRHQHVGRVLDWSYRHIMVSGGLNDGNLQAAKVEPRILFHLAERNLVPAGDATGRFQLTRDSDNVVTREHQVRRRRKIDGTDVVSSRRGAKIDWSIQLGNGIVAANMFPGKFSFDINAAPDCVNDYVVFGLNVAGVTAGQANLLGVNNLYSGNPAGLCGANPRVNWAYNGSTGGGSILTSPVISLDGKKIAYVESTATSAIFHTLTWKGGEGNSATNAVAPGNCASGASCLRSLTFSTTATDTLASLWVDYPTDKGFVGGDDGKIYRISCVFAAGCTTPTVDWTYNLPVKGSGGSPATPNGPVYDAATGHLFVADQLGEVWVINAGGASPSLAAGPVMIGGGGCTTAHPPGRTGTGAGGDCVADGGSFGIPDSIIMDGNSGRIFAFSGNDGTGALVAQLKTDLTGLVRVHVGLGSVGATIANWNIHSGTFDDPYFGATPAAGRLFMCGTGPGDTVPYHYWIGFAAYPLMDAAPTGSLIRLAGAVNVPCAPYTELFNPNITLTGGGHDLLVSGLMGPAGEGFIITNNISNGNVVVGHGTNQPYAGGVSGIIIDNVSTAAQASSVYFTTQGAVTQGTCGPPAARCAVKLTQLNLQ
jgi:hypothetical protein